MRAIAVFHGHGTHPLKFLLKSGFAHCFVVVAAGDYWVRIDGMNGIPAVEVVAGTDYDLAGFYRDQGYAVIETEQRGGVMCPFVVANCVGICKSVLGIRSWAFTPYQLWKHLVKR